MELKIENHYKIEILFLLKNKYNEKLNPNLYSVKWLQYDNNCYVELILKENKNITICEEIRIASGDWITDSEGDLVHDIENRPISEDFFNPYDDIVTNAMKFVNDDDDYSKIMMVENIFTNDYIKEILNNQGEYSNLFLMQFNTELDFFEYFNSNFNLNYITEAYFKMLFNNLYNYKFDSFHASIVAVLFKIINDKNGFKCNDTTSLHNIILTTFAVKQIVYEYYCVVCNDFDYNTLESIENEIDDIIEMHFFPQNELLKANFEANYLSILENVKSTIIEYYESQVLNEKVNALWWNKFLVDIDNPLDYSSHSSSRKRNAINEYLSNGFNYC